MSLDLLTGLLLTAVLLLGIGYVVKELAGDALAGFFSAHTAPESEDPNKRLIGEVGEVVGAGADGGMRVRVGIERWHARLESGGDEDTLPVGTEVRVAGVEGSALRVEQSSSG